MDKHAEFEREYLRLQLKSLPKDKHNDYLIDAMSFQMMLRSTPTDNRSENLSFDDLERRLSGLKYGIMDNPVAVPLEFGGTQWEN